jgi:hypothetical protein
MRIVRAKICSVFLGHAPDYKCSYEWEGCHCDHGSRRWKEPLLSTTSPFVVRHCFGSQPSSLSYPRSGTSYFLLVHHFPPLSYMWTTQCMDLAVKEMTFCSISACDNCLKVVHPLMLYLSLWQVVILT